MDDIRNCFQDQYKFSVFLAARADIFFVMLFLDVQEPKWRRQNNYIYCQTQMVNLTILNFVGDISLFEQMSGLTVNICVWMISVNGFGNLYMLHARLPRFSLIGLQYFLLNSFYFKPKPLDTLFYFRQTNHNCTHSLFVQFSFCTKSVELYPKLDHVLSQAKFSAFAHETITLQCNTQHEGFLLYASG